MDHGKGKVYLYEDLPDNLWRAAECGDIPALRDLLSKGANINRRRSGEDMSPLVLAIYSEQVEAARFLLSRGADPNLRDLYRWSPLMHAAAGSHVELVKVLLEARADVSIRGDLNDPDTPALTLARAEGHALRDDFLRCAEVEKD